MQIQERLLKQCQQELKELPTQRLLIGYSGGRDSHVLLDIIYQLRQRRLLKNDLLAIHVNHKQQEKSDAWEQHCQEVCHSYEIPLIKESVSVSPKTGESIEAFLRQCRYQLIQKHIKSQDVFISGHHQRDQAETFLLQLMRGSGIDGLKSMPLVKKFGNGLYLRPLLGTKYLDIVEYACQKQLHFVDDTSNNNTRFDRNYIRHEVLPALIKRFSKAEQAIARSATWLSEAPKNQVPEKLSISNLQRLTHEQQKRDIRSFIKQKISQSLSQKQTQYIIENHLQAAADRHPQLTVKENIIRRFNDEIIVTKALPDLPKESFLSGKARVGQSKKINDFAELCWEKKPLGLVAGDYDVRPLDTRMRFHPHYRKHSTTVKKILYESQVPAWLRDFFPGLFDGESLVAIPSIGVAKRYCQKSQDAAMPMWIINSKFVKM